MDHQVFVVKNLSQEVAQMVAMVGVVLLSKKELK